LYPLTKLLKLRSLFRELENPSAQNSRTVSLAPDTHDLLQKHNGEKTTADSPGLGVPK
jgi:hypothetical protein